MASATLSIACAVNDGYVLPLLVMLRSLREHLRPSVRPVLYLIHRGLSQRNLAAISTEMETRPIVAARESTWAIPGHAHYPPEAAYPLLLPELLPDTLDRVLFLDADLLVLDDVSRLWETCLDGYSLAAAPDAAIPFCRSPRGVKKPERLGIPEGAVYFNGGVLLMDLDRWRQREIPRRACKYLEQAGGQVDFLHQEALNAILWDDWLKLDCRWNLLASLAGRPYAPRALTGWQDPGIVHFAGRFKPWKAPVGGPFNGRYETYLKQAQTSVPALKPSPMDRLLGVYDLHFRNTLYRCERALWNLRLV